MKDEPSGDVGIILGRKVCLNLLLTLAGLFFLRVVVQLIQYFFAVDFLPNFESWQSGALPYSVLLASQVLILAVQVVFIYKAWKGSLKFKKRSCQFLLGLGTIYFVAMLCRLVLGLTTQNGHSWFDAPMPSIFHMILASFVIMLSVTADRNDDE